MVVVVVVDGEEEHGMAVVHHEGRPATEVWRLGRDAVVRWIGRPIYVFQLGIHGLLLGMRRSHFD